MGIKRKIVLIIIITLLIFLSACILQTREIESLGIIHTRGIDIAADDDNQIETSLIVFQFDAQSEEITTTLYGKGHTLKQSLNDAGRQTRYALTPGQIRVEIYSKEIAQRGIIPYISTLVRDSRVADTMFLAISNTHAKELLTKGQDAVTSTVGQYIEGILEKEIEENVIPNSSLYDFSRRETEIGQDPVLPIIDLVEDKPALTGLAVFKDDKLVGEVSLEDAYLIQQFLDTTKNTPLDITIPLEPFKKYMKNREELKDKENLHLRLTVIKGKNKAKLTDFEKLNYKANIDIETDLYELSEHIRIDDEKILNLLEKEVEKEITRQYDTLFAKLQELNTDPFGLGTIYHSKKREGNFTTEEWREKYPDVTMDFNINVEIKHYGTIQ
ncbi:Ger(x)C family spore germination protein [Oceanobacillus sp. CF4.6]|uniref:Ger(x)C family spore germination protein n=1 Tax=Oceanobacillus sp. CF4.6 TaxID=3373080 RepID=UPI003EE59D24